MQAKLQSLINFFQFEYYRKISKKLSNLYTTSKCYWTPLKTLLNGRKILCTPALFHDNKFITNFKEKSKKDKVNSKKLIVTILSVFACLNYVINPLVNLLILSSNLVWRKAFSHQNGKKQISYQFTKKTTSSVLKTTDLSPFSQSVAKFLSILFTARF